MISHDFVEAQYERAETLRWRRRAEIGHDGRGDSIHVRKKEGLESVVNAGCRSVSQKVMRADRNSTNILSVPRTKVSNEFLI